MTGNEVRTTFLNYFGRNGHKIVKSSPLLPAHDPTLLFINAGMNQFKDVFLGAEKRDYKRAASSQKCVRAGGKHNDLDEVGKTARHHTFFEMLGNFSFGDYFKEDAIRFAWDLLVNEWKLDPERMWFTVFEGDDEVPADDEAAALWVKVGAKPERILRFGRKDNFWQMAETGPCGPNSEINYYLGPHPEDPNFNKREYVNGPGDETVEIWNLVFMQYNRIEEAPGKFRLEPLPAPSVDTGAGLERVTAVLQGVKSAYETDLIRPIIDFTAKLAGKKYVYDDSEDNVSMRVIADHARATAFLIADGIFPGRDTRGYVLRKIMRRAIWHGNKLGFKDIFFAKVTNFVVDQFGEAYPELRETRGVIERVVTTEEKLYGSTVGAGLNVLEDVMKKTSGKVISGADVFKLYDTYGLNYDLIEYVATQRGFTLDQEGFDAELEKQRQRARESMKGG
ncbi:MAG TPA: alanine--tRNA ligase, partial [Blastocatellia bacterium]|nr:alanine--tRNA ligase [Blastocatellia bacterium]